MKALYSTALLLSVSILSTKAQSDSTKTTPSNTIGKNLMGKVPIGKPYWGNSLDGMIFSTALINNGGSKSLGTLRFSMFLHFGATYNYNFSKNVGIYTGVDFKNIGFIEKFDFLNTTSKHRVYTLGVPIGMRFGNMKTRDYVMLGGGLDIALNYKNKFWNDNQSKTKFNEWFSDYTNILMPYVFTGVSFKGTTIKIQYYPTNFFNENKSTGFDAFGNPIKPFVNKKVNLLLFSLGRDIKFSKKK